jgi:nucleoside-diphosphate-sugar epimerase
MVGKALGVTPEIEFGEARAGELLRSSLDIAKAKRVLGWEPKYTIGDGLPHLIEWFKQGAK